MRKKSVYFNLKKILVLTILSLFLSSSIFIGTTGSEPENLDSDTRLALSPAQKDIAQIEQSHSNVVKKSNENNIIYGDDWSEVINPDGSRTRTIGKPTYYRDGSYHPVDPNFVPIDVGEYQFGVESGKYQVYFKEDIAEPMPVMVNYNDYELSMQFNEIGYFDYQTNNYETMPVQSSIGSPEKYKMNYKNILPDMDLEYEYGVGELKENFIINDISNYNFQTNTGEETLELSFDINFQQDLVVWTGGKPVSNSITTSLDIEIRNLLGETIFIIPKPLIFEQNDPMKQINGEYEITITNFGAKISLKTPITWLTDTQRSFPVVIDPSILTTVHTTKCMGLYNIGSGTHVIGYVGWYSNYFMYGLGEFNLTTIPAYSTVLDAEFFIYTYSVNGGGGRGILPFRIIEDWEEASLKTAYDVPLLAENYTNGQDMTVDESWYGWNITALVQGWVSQYYANHGLAITTNKPWGINRYNNCYSDTGTYPPYLNITYVNNSLQIAPPINEIITNEDTSKNIRLSNNEHRRFEKFNARKDTGLNPPFWGGSYDSGRSQFLYFPEDIGMGGIIDRISFHKQGSGTGTYGNFSVRFAHTALSELTTDFDKNYQGELIEVFNQTNLSINQPVDSWIILDVNNIFNYQIGYKLVVDIRYNDATGSTARVWAKDRTNSLVYDTSSYYATTGTVNSFQANIRFETISTNEVSINIERSSATWLPFDDSIGKKHRTQFLYRQHMIGKAGIIDKIYLSKADSVKGGYENFSVIFANTNLTEVTTNYSYNYGSGIPTLAMDNQTFFVSGSIDSWLEIDVDDSFYYNNYDNLIVEFRWNNGNNTNNINSYIKSMKYDCTNYNSVDDYAKLGALWDGLLTIKIKFKEVNLTWGVSGVNNDLIDVSPSGPPGNDQFSITPVTNANGEDTVRFTLTDTLNGWSTYQDVNIIVEPVNDPPITPYNLTPGQKPYKEWFSGPIFISWEHMDVDSPQDNVSIEYRVGTSGGWQKLFNSSDFGVPFPDPDYLWTDPVSEDEIYIRVSTFDGEYWSPWNVSQNPIGFDNTSMIIQRVEILDLNKTNTKFVKNGHDVLITAFLTEKFFTGFLTSEPVFYSDLTAFGSGADVPGNLSDFPTKVTWRIDSVTTTPLNGLVHLYIWGDPEILGFDIDIAANTTADNLPVMIREPSIMPERWINQTEDIKFSVNISDEGSGVNFSSMQYRVRLHGSDIWGPWVNISLSRNRGNYIIPEIVLNLKEGGNNKVQTRGQDIIGNDYVESPVYTIKVDESGVKYNELGAGTSIWFKNTKVLARINITDNVSGVQLNSIKYRFSTNGKGGYSNWTKLPIDNVTVKGKSVICTAEVDLVEGIGNYIQWYSRDLAGNELESDHLNYKVDMTAPSFLNADPENNGFVNNYSYKCSIDIDDAVSGVNTSSIQYRTSNNGIDKYGPWQTPTIGGGTRAIKATGTGNFSDGSENYIQWRAMDFAGNSKTSIDYKLSIDLTPPTFSNVLPIQTSDPATWSPTKEVNCSITITDATSDIEAPSLNYRFSKTGNADSDFGAWQSLGLSEEENDKSITVSVKLSFEFGDDNWIQWRAADKAGNIIVSDKYQVRIKETDTDGDNMPDDWEIKYDLDPNDSSDADDDDDDDGLTNLEEYNLIADYGQSTDPTDPDTDGDGFDDGTEVEEDTNPFNDADIPEIKDVKDEEEGGFNFMWVLIIIVIIIVVLLLIFLFMRRKKPEEKEVPPAEYEEEGEEEESDEEVSGWELADEEEEEEDFDEEDEFDRDEQEPPLEEEPELETELEEDDDLIDFEMDEEAAKPAKGKPPVPSGGAAKLKGKGKTKGKKPEKDVEEEEFEDFEDFEELEADEFEDDELEDIDLGEEEDEELEPDLDKKEPSVDRRGKKPIKKKMPVEIKKPMKTKSKLKKKGKPAPMDGPLLMHLEQSTTCNICLGVIKTGLTVVKCKCGKKYHDSCADRVGICPSCDTDLSNPVSMIDEPEEMTDDDLEAFDLDSE